VADAAVVGAPSAEWGETVVAFVVTPDGEAAEEELARWCAERLAPYKRPRGWRWVEAIPRNALGKILRHELAP
jgi:acyl-coenzyme A synthetase/AMP-(fatty) acid ligase